MGNGTRTVAIVLALVVGVAVGWLIGHGQPSTTKPEPTPIPAPTAPAPTPTAQPVAHAPYPTPPPPYPAHKSWVITVGPKACDVMADGKKLDVAVIRKGGNDTLWFKPSADQKDLAIVFYVPPNCPKPFKFMTLAGYEPDGTARWALVCDQPGHKCFTGPAEPDACAGPSGSGGTYYKIDQSISGETCDAGIIIEQ